MTTAAGWFPDPNDHPKPRCWNGWSDSRVQRGMRHTVVFFAPLLSVSLLALAGCTSSETPTVAPTPSVSSLETVQPNLLGDMPDHQFPLPTSDWKEGDFAEQALLAATLHREGRCLVAGSARNPTAVVWPAGFIATRSSDGIISVYNLDGSVVASSGEKVSVGGGFGPTNIRPWKNISCVGKYDGVFVVQDAMIGNNP